MPYSAYVLQERHRLGQRTVNDKVFVGGKHHVRRGHAHHAMGELVLQFPVVVLRHMQVLDPVVPLRDVGVGLRGGIQHQQFARQRAVELHRPAQERRPVVGDQHHRQQIPRSCAFPCSDCLFRNVVACITFPQNFESTNELGMMWLLSEPDRR